MEEWRAIAGYEGKYEVSSEGRIRNAKGIILHPYKTSKGYLRIALEVGGHRRRVFVHRLVIEAFVGPIGKGFETNHIDGDKANNRRSNLEVVTGSENMRHAYRTGLADRWFHSALTDKIVAAIRQKYIPYTYTMRQLANEYGVSVRTIGNVLAGRYWPL